MASIGTQEIKTNAEINKNFYGFWRNFDEVGQKLPLIFVHRKHNIILCMYRHCTVYIPIQRSLILIQRSQNCNLCTELMNNQGAKIETIRAVQKIPVKILPVN